MAPQPVPILVSCAYNNLSHFQAVHVCYLYYLSKFSEFVDTVSGGCIYSKYLMINILEFEIEIFAFFSSVLWLKRISTKSRCCTLFITESYPYLFGLVLDTFPEAMQPFLVLLMYSFTFSCTAITCWLPWVSDEFLSSRGERFSKVVKSCFWQEFFTF